MMDRRLCECRGSEFEASAEDAGWERCTSCAGWRALPAPVVMGPSDREARLAEALNAVHGAGPEVEPVMPEKPSKAWLEGHARGLWDAARVARVALAKPVEQPDAEA